MADKKGKAGVYIALVNMTDIKGGKKYAPGDEVTLTEEQATVHLAKGSVKAK